MKRRRKPVEPALKDWSAADLSLARLCQLDAARKKTELAMNAAINAAKEKYLPALNNIQTEDAVLRSELEQFARARRDDFDPKKSLERLHGILSWRTSPPAVKLLSRKWNWTKAIEATRALASDFVRAKFEINKEAVLASGAPDPFLAQMGLKIAHDETFGLELKYEESPDHVGP